MHLPAPSDNRTLPGNSSDDTCEAPALHYGEGEALIFALDDTNIDHWGWADTGALRDGCSSRRFARSARFYYCRCGIRYEKEYAMLSMSYKHLA